MPKVNLTKALTVNLDSGEAVSLPAGYQDVSSDIASHWYVQLHMIPLDENQDGVIDQSELLSAAEHTIDGLRKQNTQLASDKAELVSHSAKLVKHNAQFAIDNSFLASDNTKLKQQIDELQASLIAEQAKAQALQQPDPEPAKSKPPAKTTGPTKPAE